MEGLEQQRGLDPLSAIVSKTAGRVTRSPAMRSFLRGTWMGHSIHPVVTVIPLGAWASATALDLIGGASARSAARRLVALGVLGYLPAAATGLAEFQNAGIPERRVASTHAVLNSTALALFVASFVVRGRRHGMGVELGLVGNVVVAASGHLGGHLAAVRHVSSRHPYFAGLDPLPDVTTSGRHDGLS